MCVCEDRLCVCVWAHVLMYVKRISTHCQWVQIAWSDFRLFFSSSVMFFVRAYVLMYVKRLAFMYVCGRFSYLCTFVELAVFVCIREPFSFGPTFGEDFGFDVMFLLM